MESLLHPFYDDLYKPSFIKSIEGLEKMPDLFNFTEFEKNNYGDIVNQILDKVQKNINN